MNQLGLLLGRSRHNEDVLYLRLAEPLGQALSAFDFHNHRIRVYETSAEPFLSSELATELVGELADGERFSKLTVYAADDDEAWAVGGYSREGVLRGFFADGSDAVLWTRYSDDERATESNADEHERILGIAKTKMTESAQPEEVDRPQAAVPDPYRLRSASPSDAAAISQLMTSVFDEYPSSMTEEHLSKQIATHRSIFRVVEGPEQQLVAAAAAEIDFRRHSAEITDCVTHPDARGQGLSTAAVQALHGDLRSRYRVDALYSLARSVDTGINCVLARLGYDYTGRLVNNCRMPDGWESMNVWTRRLAP